MATPIWPIEGVTLNSTGELIAGSLGGLVQNLYNANYTQTRCYPTLAKGADVVSGVANWAISAGYSAIVPINTITSNYHVSAVIVETAGAFNGEYELVLYYGAGHTLMATARFAVVGGFILNPFMLVPSVLIPANTQIDARLAYSLGGGGAATVTMSIVYRLL